MKVKQHRQMPILPPDDDAYSFDGLNPERVLAGWTEAITKLYENYRELSAYIDQASDQNDQHTDDTIYIGQCPVNQLVGLVITMQDELTKLLQDVSKEDNLIKLTPQKHYKKLMEHTLQLDKLNQQALSRLHLLSLSSS